MCDYQQKSQSATKISHQITPVQRTHFIHCGCSVEACQTNLIGATETCNLGSADCHLELPRYIPGPFGTKLPQCLAVRVKIFFKIRGITIIPPVNSQEIMRGGMFIFFQYEIIGEKVRVLIRDLSQVRKAHHT